MVRPYNGCNRHSWEWSYKGLCSVNWATKAIDLVSRRIHKPDLVSADAEEPFDAVSNGLPMVGDVAVVAAVVDSSVGPGATVMVFGHRMRIATVMTGGNGLEV